MSDLSDMGRVGQVLEVLRDAAEGDSVGGETAHGLVDQVASVIRDMATRVACNSITAKEELDLLMASARDDDLPRCVYCGVLGYFGHSDECMWVDRVDELSRIANMSPPDPYLALAIVKGEAIIEATSDSMAYLHVYSLDHRGWFSGQLAYDNVVYWASLSVLTHRLVSWRDLNERQRSRVMRMWRAEQRPTVPSETHGR